MKTLCRSIDWSLILQYNYHNPMYFCEKLLRFQHKCVYFRENRKMYTTYKTVSGGVTAGQQISRSRVLQTPGPFAGMLMTWYISGLFQNKINSYQLSSFKPS